MSRSPAVVALVVAVLCSGACDAADGARPGDTIASEVADTTAVSERDVAVDIDEVTAVDSADTAVDTLGEPPALGLNDITLLLPLPEPEAEPLVPITSLVPQPVFTALVLEPGDIFTDYERFRVVAVRFDLCDRLAPGPCPTEADGRLRLVLQPISDFGAEDTAIHTFFPIPNAELADAVDALEDLAALQGTPRDAALDVNVALATEPDGAYRDALRAFILRFAAPERLFRLTLFSQFSMHAALHWMFRGVVRDGDTLVPITIPDIAVPQQEALLLGDTSYQVDPISDAPAGLAVALDESRFAAASPTDQGHALAALDAIDDPLRHTAETVQCIACHASTNVLQSRRAAAGLEPPTDMPLGDDSRTRTLRALGWFGDRPIASRRVVHESRQVLAELAARFSR